MLEKKVSQAVIRRLPRYHTHLSELHSMGVAKISSKELGDRMGLTASQVRQDFNCFGGFGQQGYGYPVDGLLDSIGEILRLNDEKNAVIIGAGNLGQAIINNFDFFQNGFRLIAAFDADPALIGTEISGVPVYDVKTLREYCSKNHPDVGVLTMPKIYAREIAGILCDCGIRGIWNFTNTDLHLDIDAVPVENVHFAESLMVLSYKIGEKK
ncbi:MAG: redox-sensing transcriptional repressor Rex [Clostridia bacterium]|nr:redox-sensing transcriptional repressor Rex [Clostridia bacterium]